MSDIKQVKYDIPVPVLKKTRKGRPRSATVSKTPKALNKMVKPSFAINKPANTAATVPNVVNSNTDTKLNNAKTLQTVLNSATNTTLSNKKKPAVSVNIPYAESPHTPSPTQGKKTLQTPIPVKVIEKPVSPNIRKVQPRVNIQPTKRKNFTMKRKFIARRIVINIENANKSKKNRDSIEKKVSNMPLCDITKNLRENGMVRAGISPPEKMQRAMMIDLLMFPAPQ